MNVFRRVLKFTKLPDRKTVISSLESQFSTRSNICPESTELCFCSLGKLPHLCFNLLTVISWRQKKLFIIRVQRIHKLLKLFKLLTIKFPWISGSELLLHLCPASSVSWSTRATVLILNSYMKSCLLHYNSTLKIKVSVQHTQYPKALITSSLHIGQVRWSKSQGSMHVLWKTCLKKEMLFRTYHESHTLFLQMMCKLLH